eukprot:11224257-Lingulodinium_polyedra.AAC.1
MDGFRASEQHIIPLACWAFSAIGKLAGKVPDHDDDQDGGVEVVSPRHGHDATDGVGGLGAERWEPPQVER